MPDLSRRALLASITAAAATIALPASPAPLSGAVIIDDPWHSVPPAPRPLPTLPELKALSERALAALERHWPEHIYGETFLSEGDSPHGLVIRCDCPDRPDPSHGQSCYRCSSVLPGTPMIGAMSGYYEPEWDERTTYGILQDVTWWNARPATISDADWAEVLAIVGMTPQSHAERMADLARQIGEADAAWDRFAEEWNSKNPEVARA